VKPSARQVLVITAITCGLGFLQSYLSLLEFEREKILTGEFWRLWTAHWVHSDRRHWMLNVMAGLVLYALLLANIRTAKLVVLCILLSGLLGVALFVFHPNLNWYNGLSGLLHALAAYCLVWQIGRGGHFYGWALLLLWLKVSGESIQVYLGHTVMMGELRVITEAHLMGALLGSCLAAIELFTLKTKRPA